MIRVREYLATAHSPGMGMGDAPKFPASMTTFTPEKVLEEHPCRNTLGRPGLHVTRPRSCGRGTRRSRPRSGFGQLPPARACSRVTDASPPRPRSLHCFQCRSCTHRQRRAPPAGGRVGGRVRAAPLSRRLPSPPPSLLLVVLGVDHRRDRGRRFRTVLGFRRTLFCVGACPR